MQTSQHLIISPAPLSNRIMSTIEDQRAKAGFKYSEDIAPGLEVHMDLRKIHIRTLSEFQKIDVIETYFGKMLITDGKTQSAQSDEFAYHESLVHPPLIQSAILAGAADGGDVSSNKPRSVFIGGGGELATAREVLRHRSVERVVMVDLDGKVIEVCKEYLPEWGGDQVANNPRLELIVGDAYAYLKDCKEQFDCIIMDISDPIEAGPGIMLYTQEFYQHCTTLLSPNGVFVTQAGVAESIPPKHAVDGTNDTSCFGPIYNTLGSVFDCVVPYSSNIPSFGSDWGFCMAYNSKEAVSSWTGIAPEALDSMIEERITDIESAGKEGNVGPTDVLMFYDGIAHKRMFALTKPLRQALKKDARIMTEANPVFMY